MAGSPASSQIRANTVPAVHGLTLLPVPETKKFARPGNLARDCWSHASRTRATWGVTGSLRLRFPFDQTMSMCPCCRST